MALVFKKLLILVLIVAAMIVAFQLQQYVKNLIDARKSFLHLLLLLVISILVIFGLVFITGFIIIFFKDFFFKK